jgi:zinc/manganese transport system substrate-binding protein
MAKRSSLTALSIPVSLASIGALTLGGCGSDANPKADLASGKSVSVVASTNVYGDIAGVIAGDYATVTSVITSPTQDPHEYEVTARDRLALGDAEIVIANGGGYDPFMATLLEASSSDPVVLDAVEISGLKAESGGEEVEDSHAEEGGDEDGHIEGFNEHVWYEFHAVEKLAERLSVELGKVDPDHAADYQDNYEEFAGQIEELEAGVEEASTLSRGRGVAMTEPLPVYLLAEAGLADRTPSDFSESVEEGADVPPRALQEILDIVEGGEVAVLAYNSQTADATTEQVRVAAEEADIPVVDFTETLPEGQSYVEWQRTNLENLRAALA